MIQIAQINDQWALAYDPLQWVLQRRSRTRTGADRWNPVSFVSSTKAILARCMREKGVPDRDSGPILDALPATFGDFLVAQAVQSRKSPGGVPQTAPEGFRALYTAEAHDGGL